MKKRLWFRQKEYGYGWVPSTWEGWLVIVLYVCMLLYVARDVKDIKSLGLYFFLKIILLVSTLITICYIKGEKPKWRWGKR